jgi:hypothetical protein
MKSVVPLVAVLVVAGCKRSESPTSTTAPPPAAPTTVSAAATPAPAAASTTPKEKMWKVKPTALAVIKADPPSYLGEPTLVFVTVKPTSYFNYGYSNARNSHFAFEMRPAEESGRLGEAKLYGYAARSWARAFFEEVNKQLDASKKEFAPATLVVAYSKKRYDGRSADHIEILAADVGEKFDMDPATVAQASGADGNQRADARPLRLKFVAAYCGEYVGSWDESSRQGDWMDGEGMTVRCQLTEPDDARCVESWPQPGRVSTSYEGSFRVNKNGSIVVNLAEVKKPDSLAMLGYLPSGKGGKFRTWNRQGVSGLDCLGAVTADGRIAATR